MKTNFAFSRVPYRVEHYGTVPGAAGYFITNLTHSHRLDDKDEAEAIAYALNLARAHVKIAKALNAIESATEDFRAAS